MFAVFCAICHGRANLDNPCPDHGLKHIRCVDDVDGGWEQTESFARDLTARECASLSVPQWAIEEERRWRELGDG